MNEFNLTDFKYHGYNQDELNTMILFYQEHSSIKMVTEIAIQVKEIAAQAAKIEELEKMADLEMERLKACEHIAEGEIGCEVLFPLCPSTQAVSVLCLKFEKVNQEFLSLKAKLEKARGALQYVLDQGKVVEGEGVWLGHSGQIKIEEALRGIV